MYDLYFFSILWGELTPRSFSNISRLFTNIQFVSLHKSKLRWKMHLFCKRNFLIRSIVRPLFWYELSREKYDFQVLVITIKLSTWSKKIFHKKDVSFIVVLIHVKKLKFVNNWDISTDICGYIQLPNFTEFTPQIFLGCLQTYSLFLYINWNYDEKCIYFVKDIFWSD